MLYINSGRTPLGINPQPLIYDLAWQQSQHTVIMDAPHRSIISQIANQLSYGSVQHLTVQHLSVQHLSLGTDVLGIGQEKGVWTICIDHQLCKLYYCAASPTVVDSVVSAVVHLQLSGIIGA